jgi:CRP-like cAMP-binding protein
MATTGTQIKSGLRELKPGEILFNDSEPADSLFIIQKGQIRLFKPKGKGFIEIGVLRAGEVIGEMAFFDEDGSGKKRSCSAAALTPVEVVEISFLAFGKTMQSLNPWFKTIINTLATRLRKANTRIKELEDNQTANYGKNSGT